MITILYLLGALAMLVPCAMALGWFLDWPHYRKQPKPGLGPDKPFHAPEKHIRNYVNRRRELKRRGLM